MAPRANGDIQRPLADAPQSVPASRGRRHRRLCHRSNRGLRGSEIRVKDLGDDTYEGGAGRDSVSAGEASTTPVFVDLSAGRASSDSLGEDVLANIETVYGSPYDDTLLGDDGPNRLMGGGYPYTLGRPMGNDRLVGRGGDDVLDGLDGAVGSKYDDSVDAGEGNDFCTVDPDDELISCETHGAQYPPR
jgi:hypothetical protein